MLFTCRVRVAEEILKDGVAMFPFVMAIIDTNRDGDISTREQRIYVERVPADFSLAVDGDRLKL